MPEVDAVVVGAGPNGLAAAIELGRAGRSVVVYEAADTPGGGCRSAELTEPGFVHDVCAAIHPTLVASPFMRSLPLAEHGVELIHPGAPFAHPLDDGTAVVVERSVDETIRGLGPDAAVYERLVGPLSKRGESLAAHVLGPLRVPRRPVLLGRFGVRAWRSAEGLAGRFTGDRAPAVLAGVAAHTMLPLDRTVTGGVGLFFLLLAHSVGWPLVRGGSERVIDAMVAELAACGGKIETGREIHTIDELPQADAYLFDVTPWQMLKIAGHRFPSRYRRQLAGYRYGPGVFKVDWALDGPVPWADEGCLRAGTVHIGGTFREIAEAEATVVRGGIPERPYVLVSQQSLFDPTRAPEGRHTLWAYCHVPNGSTVDMTSRIEAQIERFAPGFRDRILARATKGPADFERYNANDVGGDIAGGLSDLRQFLFRPVMRLDPYATPDPQVFICSSSTPPGPGVHGMSGYHAAQRALRRTG